MQVYFRRKISFHITINHVALFDREKKQQQQILIENDKNMMCTLNDESFVKD